MNELMIRCQIKNNSFRLEELVLIPKGRLKEPELVKVNCQFCSKEFEYLRVSSSIRKGCYDCLPLGRESDAALIRRLFKLKMVKEFGNKCYYCKGEFHPAVFDFHHVNPSEKEFGFGDKTSPLTWKRIEKEMKKCVMLCANCHRLHHAGAIVLDVVNDV